MSLKHHRIQGQHTNIYHNEQLETNICKTAPLTLSSPQMKQLGITYMQDLYAKSYKMLMKEIRENLNK